MFACAFLVFPGLPLPLALFVAQHTLSWVQAVHEKRDFRLGITM
jgi:hypothetical protein